MRLTLSLLVVAAIFVATPSMAGDAQQQAKIMKQKLKGGVGAAPSGFEVPGGTWYEPNPSGRGQTYSNRNAPGNGPSVVRFWKNHDWDGNGTE